MFDKNLKIVIKHGFNNSPGFDWEISEDPNRLTPVGYGNAATPAEAFAAAVKSAEELTAKWEADNAA